MVRLGPDLVSVKKTSNKKIVEIKPPAEAISSLPIVDRLPGSLSPESFLPRLRLEFPKEVELTPDYFEASAGPVFTVGFTESE